MNVIEYTKYKNFFLITDIDESSENGYLIRFFPKLSGTVKIGKGRFDILDGKAFIKATDLPDGIYTPLVKTESGAFCCERIKTESGALSSDTDDRKRGMRTVKEMINADQQIRKIKEDIEMIKSSVYGKQIF